MVNMADVGIIGGGLAGSVAAVVLGRAGISTVLLDNYDKYPEDFRCEKIEAKQFRSLQNAGVLDTVQNAGTLFDDLWVARFGRVIYKRPHNGQYGLHYTDLINTLRAEIPPDVHFVRSRVSQIATDDTYQTITLSNGDAWQVRLIVLATGPLNNTTRKQVNINRQTISECHTICVGFDVKPQDRDNFDFPALTFIGGPQNRIAYVSFFPMRGCMRVNMFLYRDRLDPWLDALRKAPVDTLTAIMPRLGRLLGDFTTGPILIRPIDLYKVDGHRQHGIVLVGDSFATSCPAAGTGAARALHDVDRLCNAYIPQWLATDGMDCSKIEQYYNDQAKVEYDAYCMKEAYYIKALTIDRSPIWRFRRFGWFGLNSMQGFLSMWDRFREMCLPRRT